MLECGMVKRRKQAVPADEALWPFGLKVSPPKPNARLRRVARDYKRRVGHD